MACLIPGVCFLCVFLQDGDLDLQVAQRPGGAGVEPAELLVHLAAAVADGADEDIAGEELAAAEAALAVAAVGKRQTTVSALDRVSNHPYGKDICVPVNC